MATDADVTYWKVTGPLGNLGDDAALGEEVLLVVRGTISRLVDTLDDGATVCTSTVKVTAAARVGARSTLADGCRKLLDRVAQDQGRLLS